MEETAATSHAAKRYDQQLSEFVSLATHDLDSPLRKLGVFIERLSESIPAGNEDAQRYMGRINACLTEMRSIVSSLAELDDVNGINGYVSCNLAAIVDAVKQDLAEKIREKNATIRISTLPTVAFNRERCYLLFRKLFENSLKFSAPGRPLQITIEAEKIPGQQMKEMGIAVDDAWYRLAFEDNGIGFNAEDAGKIFEPFQRLLGKSAYPGSGLGLTIAKKIVENHKGKIFAEEGQLQGARIVILIPEKQD